jgi:hypothetical protein
MEYYRTPQYFVTAANAGKVLFLQEAAINFLKYTGKDREGNKLEQIILEKLQYSSILAHRKVDALMFHHVYCNLVLLATSSHFNKNVFNMNQHYLELHVFLETVEQHPTTAMDKNLEVFVSEKRLYGNGSLLNHFSYKFVEEKIFSKDDSDEILLYLLLVF